MDKKDNFLDYVPLRNCPFGTDDKGRVYLVKEKTKSKLLKKIILALGRSQEFHIHLDELGTAAWLAVDGRRTILEIAAGLKSAAGGAVDQAEPRLAKFFAMLARDGFISWKELS
ncbi:MAG TPA: PqqD family protein [Candidatus Aminicenantes bacterium]|nr:PqqD family protein [Candidatus Aminicenantes bacterium]